MSGQSYKDVMARRAAIVLASVGIDYERYSTGALAFDYEGLLADAGYDLDTARRVQSRTAVGDTPLVELPNITALVRAVSAPGKGARVFLKDEAANPTGSFKDRRASLSVHEPVGLAASSLRKTRAPLPGAETARTSAVTLGNSTSGVSPTAVRDCTRRAVSRS